MNPLKKARKQLAQSNRRYSELFVDVPSSEWPVSQGFKKSVAKVLRSKDFLVQVYHTSSNVHRLSICRSAIDSKGQWKDGISWEELQRIKTQCGYGDRDAVEVYPADKDVVNVANMRHLWVFMDAELPFKWKAK